MNTLNKRLLTVGLAIVLIASIFVIYKNASKQPNPKLESTEIVSVLNPSMKEDITIAKNQNHIIPIQIPKKTELIKHTPVWIDIKIGKIIIPLEQIYNPPPEYTYNENGKLTKIVFANKSNIHIEYNSNNMVTKIIGPGIKKTIVSYPDKFTRKIAQSVNKTT